MRIVRWTRARLPPAEGSALADERRRESTWITPIAVSGRSRKIASNCGFAIVRTRTIPRAMRVATRGLWVIAPHLPHGIAWRANGHDPVHRSPHNASRRNHTLVITPSGAPALEPWRRKGAAAAQKAQRRERRNPLRFLDRVSQVRILLGAQCDVSRHRSDVSRVIVPHQLRPWGW